MFADIEVVAFHPLLGVFDGVAHQAVFDGLAVLHPQAAHEALDAVAAEDPQQVVFQGEVEAGRAGVALAAGAAAELVVDAPGFVALGAQDVEAAGRHHAFAQDDVGARPAMLVAMVTMPFCPAWATISASFSWCLAFRTSCLMPSRFSILLRYSDFSMEMVPTRTGWPRSVAVLDILHHGLEFFFLGLVDDVGIVHADHLHVGGNDHHFQVVDLLELLGFGVGGAGHAGQLLVHAEVVLEGDGGQGLVFVFDLDRFLGLQGLVQAVGVAPAGHEAPGEFVDDDDLAFLDDVVHVPFEEGMGLQGGLEVVQDSMFRGS